MWCESSWASEALQIGRGGAEDGSPHSCFSHSHFSETVDFISCRPHYRTLLCAFSLLWFSVLSLFFFLTCSSPGCLFLSRVSCCACFCDFYSPFFFFFFTFFSPTPSRCCDMTAIHLNFPNLSRLPEQDTLSHRHIYHKVLTFLIDL